MLTLVVKFCEKLSNWMSIFLCLWVCILVIQTCRSKWSSEYMILLPCDRFPLGWNYTTFTHTGKNIKHCSLVSWKVKNGVPYMTSPWLLYGHWSLRMINWKKSFAPLCEHILRERGRERGMLEGCNASSSAVPTKARRGSVEEEKISYSLWMCKGRKLCDPPCL